MREGETDEQFHARVGAELDALIDEYTAWNKANGLISAVQTITSSMKT